MNAPVTTPQLSSTPPAEPSAAVAASSEETPHSAHAAPSAADDAPREAMTGTEPPASPPAPAPLMLHMPVDVRNLSLALLALFASVALLHWASAVFIPIMLSLLLTTALRPLVDVLYRYHVPRWRMILS